MHDMGLPHGQADVRALSLAPTPAPEEAVAGAEEAAGPAPAGLPETQAAAEAPAPAAGLEAAPLVVGAAGPAPEVRGFESWSVHYLSHMLFFCFSMYTWSVLQAFLLFDVFLDIYLQTGSQYCQVCFRRITSAASNAL